MRKAIPTILYINLITFGITYILSFHGIYINNILSIFPFNSGYFHPYQLLTNIFAHASIEHIFFNMLFLILFGPAVEKYFGTKKFWKFYILAGVFSSGLYCLGIGAILGASGPIFGILGAFIFTNKEDVFNLKVIKIKTYIFIIMLVLNELYSCFFVNDNIGHLVHVSGFVFGVIFYFFNRNANQ
jgi:membrane associated rhomboid family serine protease